MNFKFNIFLNDDDYLAYNEFWLLKSPYGKKQVIGLRIFIILIFGAVILFDLLKNDFSASAWLRVALYIIAVVLFEIFFNRFMLMSLKSQLKSLKKKGKMAYSTTSEVEFYDDYLVEITSESKSEIKYTSIERVSIITDSRVYMHINNVMACIVPMSAFETIKQYDEFLSFIKTKFANIDVYKEWRK